MITLLHRPYVFCFLLAFVGIAGRHLGWRRMLLWLVTGYGIALASEAWSIRTGFPYGMYHYVYENLRGEWILFGVPVWDSLSYPFLIYAGYAMASYLLHSRTHALTHCLCGAFLTLLLDIIIDPLTVRGDQWFLGRVYYYSEPGVYFGVPLANFAGWFLVPLTVIALNRALWNRRPTEVGPRFGALFYLAIACFNITITFGIGAWPLGLASTAWLFPIVFLFIRQRPRRAPYLISNCSPS